MITKSKWLDLDNSTGAWNAMGGDAYVRSNNIINQTEALIGGTSLSRSTLGSAISAYPYDSSQNSMLGSGINLSNSNLGLSPSSSGMGLRF